MVELGLRLWLAPENAIAGGDGQRVAVWRSNDSAASHGTQDTILNQPIFYTGTRAGAPNGNPFVKFTVTNDGGPTVGQFLNLPDFCSAFSSAEIFAVLKADNDPALASPAGQYLWNFASTGILDDYPNTSGNIVSTFGLNAAGGVGANPALALTSWRLYNVRRAIDDLLVYLDNVALYSNLGVGPASFPADPSIGGNGNANSYWAGSMAEIVMFNRVLETTERADVVEELSSKYGLGLVAPSAGGEWDSGWDDSEVSEARQNNGFWCEDSGMADANDQRSFGASEWW